MAYDHMKRQIGIELDLVKILNSCPLECHLWHWYPKAYLRGDTYCAQYTELYWPRIWGATKSGRMIMLHVPRAGFRVDTPSIEIRTRKIMQKAYKQMILVGVVRDFSDAYDVIADDDEYYPRKLSTYAFDPELYKHVAQCRAKQDRVKSVHHFDTLTKITKGFK